MIVYISPNPVVGDQTISEQLNADNYQHSISANIGYDKMTFSINADELELNRIFSIALNQNVTCYSADGQRVAWNGYIHSLTLSLPGLHARLSMDGIYNSVTVRYKSVDAGGTVSASDSITTAVTDSASIARYGTRQYEHIARAPLATASATQLAQMILAEYKYPRSSATISNGADSRLQFECRGYGHKLAERIYTASGSGTVGASVLVQSIIAACGQYVASSVIDTNTLQVTPVSDNSALSFNALTLLQQTAALGDASLNRWLCQVLDDRIFYYQQSPRTAKYYRSIRDPQGTLYDTNGLAVDPLEIRAGYWLMTTDTDPFAAETANPVDDSRLTFIESVSFTAPGDLSVAGGANSQIGTLLAQMAQNRTVI